MRREIQVRKKRFAAFWTAVLLVCSLVLPTTVSAANLKLADLAVGRLLAPKDIIESEGSLYCFSYSDGSSYEGTDVYEIPDYGEPPVGQVFDGWIVTGITEAPVSGGTLKTISLAPQFSAGKYTIRFVNEDGTPLQSSKVAYNETPVYSGETPTKASTAQYSYTFSGWIPALTAVTGEATYTAGYQETLNRYTITFDTDGGDPVESITQEVGTDVTAPANPTKTGYTFAGWDQEIPTTMPAGNLTIKALWTATPYRIQFVNEDGTLLQEKEVPFGEIPAYTGETPTKAATAEISYTFAGWSPEIVAVTGEATYSATYTEEARRYSIHYTLNGGTSENNPDSYSYGTGISSFADAVKPGYNFAGWYENADFSGNPVTSVAPDRAGDITLYAKFEMGTIEAGTYSLTAGVAYKLGNVTKVSGDSSVYTAGSSFYVSASGTYTFS